MFIAHMCFVLRDESLWVCVRWHRLQLLWHTYEARAVFFFKLSSLNFHTMDHLTFNTGMVKHFNAAN